MKLKPLIGALMLLAGATAVRAEVREITIAQQFKVGTIKDPPAKWRDLFFPDIHDLPGD